MPAAGATQALRLFNRPLCEIPALAYFEDKKRRPMAHKTIGRPWRMKDEE
jgi:hypothetical protein